MRLRTILFLVNGIALVGFLIMAIVGARRSKPKPPPNLTPYYDDETMEGPKLERFLGAAVIFSAILAAALPAYWLLEPTRQTKMNKDFDKDATSGDACASPWPAPCPQRGPQPGVRPLPRRQGRGRRGHLPPPAQPTGRAGQDGVVDGAVAQRRAPPVQPPTR